MAYKVTVTPDVPADLMEIAHLIIDSHVYSVEIPPNERRRIRVEFQLKDGRRFKMTPAEVEVSYEG